MNNYLAETKMKYSKVPQCMSSVHAQVCRECFCFTVCLEYALKVEFTNTILILQVPVLKMVWVLFKVKKIVLLTYWVRDQDVWRSFNKFRL